jgi:hypothetical protein
MDATLQIHSEQQMLDIIRARVDELGITYATLDAVAGLPDGYAGKLLAPRPLRRAGPIALSLILGALGYGVQLFHDEEALAKVRRRFVKRKKSKPVHHQPRCGALAAAS